MTCVTLAAYRNAIAALIHLAEGHGGESARAAATVLLSAYNGPAFQVNVVDLCSLKRSNLEHALVVIRGRAELLPEPHTLFVEGGRRFQKLWKRWDRYHVKNRGKQAC